ncbi:MAG TPA: adenosylmethionine decarboxylase [Opitutaceae bacterium]|nr:adenosylmethionine decarboxylase [Opitutaceae bacterium]
MNRAALGHHTLYDYHGCASAALRETEKLRAAMLAGIRAAGGTIVTDTFHTFSPHGVSGVVVIAESHVTIHTWPEHNYAAVDVFSCGVKLKHAVIREAIRAALQAERVEEKTFRRGEGISRKPTFLA